MSKSKQREEIEDLVRQCRRGRTVELDSLDELAQRTDERVDIVRRILARGANIRVGDVVVTPEQADILILGMQSRRRKLDPEAAAKRGGHNRVSDDNRAKALNFWNDHDLSVPQLTTYTGRSYSTLRKWFAEEYPRPDKRGRPTKPKPKRRR